MAAVIADPDDFYLEDLHPNQLQMLQSIKSNQYLFHYDGLYHEFKGIIDNTLDRERYRMADRGELNIIRARFLEITYEFSGNKG